MGNHTGKSQVNSKKKNNQTCYMLQKRETNKTVLNCEGKTRFKKKQTRTTSSLCKQFNKDHHYGIYLFISMLCCTVITSSFSPIFSQSEHLVKACWCPDSVRLERKWKGWKPWSFISFLLILQKIRELSKEKTPVFIFLLRLGRRVYNLPRS